MDTFNYHLYLGNGLRYRDESKSNFNGMVFSIFWINLMTKFLIFFTRKLKVLFVNFSNYNDVDLVLHNLNLSLDIFKDILFCLKIFTIHRFVLRS